MSTSLIVPRHVAAQALGECCGNCRFMTREKDGDRVCRRRAPTAFLVAMPADPPRVGMQLKNFSTCPLVREDSWCGDWEGRRGDAS